MKTLIRFAPNKDVTILFILCVTVALSYGIAFAEESIEHPNAGKPLTGYFVADDIDPDMEFETPISAVLYNGQIVNIPVPSGFTVTEEQRTLEGSPHTLFRYKSEQRVSIDVIFYEHSSDSNYKIYLMKNFAQDNTSINSSYTEYQQQWTEFFANLLSDTTVDFPTEVVQNTPNSFCIFTHVVGINEVGIKKAIGGLDGIFLINDIYLPIMIISYGRSLYVNKQFSITLMNKIIEIN